MQYTGNLQRMSASIDGPIIYSLQLNSNKVILNEYLGKDISLLYTGKINCIACNKITKKKLSKWLLLSLHSKN